MRSTLMEMNLCIPSATLDGGGTNTNADGGLDSPIPNPPAPPYQEVGYVGNFSGDYPIASDPAMSIDPVTGVILAHPPLSDNMPLAFVSLNSVTACC